MDKKTRPNIRYLQETHIKLIDIHRLSKRLEKDIICKWKTKAGVAVLISDKVNFSYEGYSKRQRRILHNDKGNNPTPNIGAPKYVKQILIDVKGEIDRNTAMVGDFTYH